MRPDALCGLLAERDRLAAFAAVVLGARTPGEVADRTGMLGRDVVVALRRLEQGGLLAVAAEGLVANTAAFQQAVREYGEAPALRSQEDHALPDERAGGRHQDGGRDEGDPARAQILRTFLRAGRLVQWPAARGKRRVLLEHIAAVFEPGVRYDERDVDEALRRWHDDYATIRRYLVDEGLMSREKGVYWRSGGYVDV